MTENVKNMQISAEICKSQTQAKNADINTSIENLQAAECNQLQQAPSFKIFGGGAPAARRIRIRRPRLAERGAKACRKLLPITADSKASDGPRPAADPHSKTH